LRIPAALVIAIVSVLAGALILASPLANSNIFHWTTTSGKAQEAEAAILPLNVDEKFKQKDLAGDSSSKNLKVNDNFIDPEHHCEFCTRVEYVPGSQGLAGFAYKDDKGLDFTGAKKVRFWVMGEEGDEKVKFKIAGKELGATQNGLVNKLVNGIFKDAKFALSTQEIKLGKDWKKYEVDLSGADLRSITHPFGFELSKGSTAKKQVMFIKGIVYDNEPPENPVATTKGGEEAKALAAEIVADNTEGVAPATFEFKANIAGGTEPYSIAWDFDDGESDEGDTVSHTFDEAGTYNVDLKVTDDSGQTADDSVEIQVNEQEAESSQTNTTEQTNSPEENSTSTLSNLTSGLLG
jgi:PKD repeat protein